MTAPPQLLLTEDQTCESVGLSRMTLRRLHAEGLGPTVLKIRGSVRYPVAELEKWVANMVEAQRAEQAEQCDRAGVQINDLVEAQRAEQAQRSQRSDLAGVH